MSKGAIVALVVVGLILITAIWGFVWTMGVKSTEVGLKNRYLAQDKVRETCMDGMRKTLMNEFKVNQMFADSFLKVVTATTEGRKGGNFMKWTQESSSKLGMDNETFMKMMNAIEGQIASFQRSQQVLADIWREHKTWIEDPWHSWLVGDRVLKEPVMVTSEVTKEAMQSGKLNDDLLTPK